MVSGFGEKIAKVLRITPAVPRPWLRGGWMILVFYAIGQAG